MNSQRLLILFHYGTGLMDALTGLSLVFIPSRTLDMMRVDPRTDPTLVSYLGVFVFAVGMSHLLAGRFPTDSISRERWKTIWKISALVRICVAIFVFTKIMTAQLDSPWIVVSVTDFTVALIFINLLHRRTLESP